MKNMNTQIKLKLVPYIFLVLYCIAISLPIINIYNIIIRITCITSLFALFFITDLDIIKSKIYTTTKLSIIIVLLLVVVSYFICDRVYLMLWAYIGVCLLLIQCIFMIIKKKFSIKLILERCGQILIFVNVLSIWWIIVMRVPFDINSIIFDGVEVMILLVIGFIYFWIVDTFLITPEHQIKY